MINKQMQKSLKWTDYILALAFLTLAWYLLAEYLQRPFFPSPFAVLKEFFLQIANGNMVIHFLISSIRVLSSLGLAFLLAVPLGLAMGRIPSLDRILSPLVYLLYPLPKIVFLPIIIVLFGMGNLPKIFLITLIVFFQVIVAARDAARDIPAQWVLAMRSLHAREYQVFQHLVWPVCLPKVFTALRVSLGTAIAVLFLAETFASTDGLGYFILDSMERRAFTEMYSGILAMGLLGVLAYALVDRLELRWCRWNK